MFGANRSTSRGDPAQANHRRSARAPLLEAPLRTRYRQGLDGCRGGGVPVHYCQVDSV